MTNPVKALSLTSKLFALAYFPVGVKVSVIEPSDAVKRRNGYQTGGRRLALHASLCPQLTLWLGLAWLGLAMNSFSRRLPQEEESKKAY